MKADFLSAGANVNTIIQKKTPEKGTLYRWRFEKRSIKYLNVETWWFICLTYKISGYAPNWNAKGDKRISSNVNQLERPSKCSLFEKSTGDESTLSFPQVLALSMPKYRMSIINKITWLVAVIIILGIVVDQNEYKISVCSVDRDNFPRHQLCT